MAKIKIQDKKKFLTLIIAAVAVITAVVLLIVLLGGKKDEAQDEMGAEAKYDEVVSDCTRELENYWEKIYDMTDGLDKADRIIEIKNVRVIKINSDKDPQFKNIKYIVEYDLYSNTFETAPYTIRQDSGCAAVMYMDGSVEIWADNPLNFFLESETPDSNHIKELVNEVVDLGDRYNKTINLD